MISEQENPILVHDVVVSQCGATSATSFYFVKQMPRLMPRSPFLSDPWSDIVKHITNRRVPEDLPVRPDRDKTDVETDL